MVPEALICGKCLKVMTVEDLYTTTCNPDFRTIHVHATCFKEHFEAKQKENH